MMQTHPSIISFRFKLRYFFFPFQKLLSRRIEFLRERCEFLKRDMTLLTSLIDINSIALFVSP